ncbi:MAG TPA: hypothetical protein VNT02_05290, partial [Burkholderiales bacterium]|nr:hypothetical protein [Burkholderiales bacterium]
MDIPIKADLQKAFGLPPCAEISLPKPTPMKIALPSGGSLTALSDISKGIPNDCSMSFNLMLQLGPLLGSMDCLLKILKLLKPLIDIIKSLPFPSPKLIADFVEAAVALAPCLAIPTPVAMVPFVRDILNLILKMLRCFLGQMKSVLDVMKGLGLQLKIAQDSNNAELEAAIKCAQTNSETAAAHAMQSIEPVRVILDMLSPIFDIAQVNPIAIPQLGSQTDIDSLQQT